MADEEHRESSKGKRPSVVCAGRDRESSGGGEDYLKGERRLSVTSLRLRSDVEMWLMEEVLDCFWFYVL